MSYESEGRLEVKAFCVFPLNSSLNGLPASYSSALIPLISFFPIYYFPLCDPTLAVQFECTLHRVLKWYVAANIFLSMSPVCPGYLLL